MEAQPSTRGYDQCLNIHRAVQDAWRAKTCWHTQHAIHLNAEVLWIETVQGKGTIWLLSLKSLMAVHSSLQGCTTTSLQCVFLLQLLGSQITLSLASLVGVAGA